MSQFGPLNRILIPVLRAPSSVPLQLFLTLPFSIRSSMDAITEKLFPILATPRAAARPSVFLSSVFISLVHYGKCDMPERGKKEGQLDNRGRGEVSCGSRVVARVKVWMAKVISPFLAAAAWIVFAFGRQNRMEIQNPLVDGRTSRASAREAHPVLLRLLLLLENTCLLSVHPSIHWREREGDRNKRGKGEEGPPACFR